jgi:hypothetical protein
MATIAFDTHEFVKELKDAGFSEQQAEVITKLQKAAVSSTLEQARHDYELDDLATKRDLKELENSLKKDIEILRLETRRDIAENKAELIRWVVGVGLLQITIIAGLMFRLTGKI